MITLKLAVYNEKEVEALGTLLFNSRKATMLQICPNCTNNCSTCDYRHLCIDLAQAEMYAKDYKPKR